MDVWKFAPLSELALNGWTKYSKWLRINVREKHQSVSWTLFRVSCQVALQPSTTHAARHALYWLARYIAASNTAVRARGRRDSRPPVPITEQRSHLFSKYASRLLPILPGYSSGFFFPGNPSQSPVITAFLHFIMSDKDSKSGGAVDLRPVNVDRSVVDTHDVSEKQTNSTEDDSMDMYRMGKLQELRVRLLLSP
jgi:hypothetical protein